MSEFMNTGSMYARPGRSSSSCCSFMAAMKDFKVSYAVG